METTEKKCSKCGEVKKLSEFGKNNNRKDGLQSKCKVCVLAYKKDNKDKINICAENYRKANKDKIKHIRDLNKDKMKAYSKVWRDNNKKKKASDAKLWYSNNKDKIKRKNKENATIVKNRDRYKAESLTDAYVSHQFNIPVSRCPKELIEAKRDQILLHRKLNEFKSKLKEKL